ncbi:hypothetical protein [Paraburkholderia sp.]|uniref:hypothetical protein n=1 Tax=Paraburkholderia sp. TaxID=1926495 RepID=UPI003C7C5B7F
MKERPILMNAAMVRATLRDEDPKTQTRRIVKPQPPAAAREVFTFHHPDPRTHFYGFDGDALMDWAQPCPYGEVGDRLYVRETWQHSNHPFGPYDKDCDVFYRADYLDDPLGPDLERSRDGIRREWSPSIHMPRAASRITLEITGVRVEKLNRISSDDCFAEGIDPEGADYNEGENYANAGSPVPPERWAFAALWQSTGGNWEDNPWVWVVEFKRIGS